MSVWEITEMQVAQGKEDEFVHTFQSNLSIVKNAEGALDCKLLRGVDKEGAFLLLIEWESVEHHTEVFTKSEGFTTLGAAVAPFLTAPPEFFHGAVAIDGI
jgi:heme-degrading monooxygenase HmoA